MSDKPNPFDEGREESELIKDAYESVKQAKFNFGLDPVVLVKSLHRDMAKSLYYGEPSQSSDFSKEVIPFLTYSSAVIEEKSTEVIIQNLIENTHRDKKVIQSEIAGWSQGKREDVMAQLKIIDQDLKDKMNLVRQTRNNLVHDPEKHNSLEEIEYQSHTLPDAIEAAYECVEELDSKTLDFDFSSDD